MSDIASIVDRVNFEVNQDIRYRTDLSLYGQPDFWTVVDGAGEGDCDDYTLTKRARLLTEGVPLHMIRIAVVFTETDDGRSRLAQKRAGRMDVFGDHACLVVALPIQDVVMDNRYPYPLRWADTGYDLDRIQVAGSSRWEHGVLRGSAA